MGALFSSKLTTFQECCFAERFPNVNPYSAKSNTILKGLEDFDIWYYNKTIEFDLPNNPSQSQIADFKEKVVELTNKMLENPLPKKAKKLHAH